MTDSTPTGGAGDLRAAADCLNDARTDLSYGEIEMAHEGVEAIAERIDAQIGELEQTLRELGAIAEIEAAEANDA